MMPLLCVNLDGKYNLRYNIATQHKVLQITTLLHAKEARQRLMSLSIDSDRSRRSVVRARHGHAA